MDIHNLWIHSPAESHLLIFYVMNRDPTSIQDATFMWIIFISLEYVPMSGIAGLCDTFTFNLSKLSNYFPK